MASQSTSHARGTTPRVEVDPAGYPDWESVYGTGNASDTTSIDSEVIGYKYENGRRYPTYGGGQYWGPNDDKQKEHLDMFHHVYSLVLGGELYLAPIGNNPQKILDLGTGTGIWVIDMADKFPNAKIIGNDLSPIQPTWIPLNCTFEVDDFTQNWAYSRSSFDFVHARAIYGGLSDWSHLFNESLSVLKPGGWFESVESSSKFLRDDAQGNPIPIPEDNVLFRWSVLGNEASEKLGRPLDVVGKIPGRMRRAGFVNVTERVYKVPLGSWPWDPRLKNIGKCNLSNVLHALEGMTMALFTRVLHWGPEEVQAILTEIRRECQNRKNHFYFTTHVTYGQKPQ